MVNAMVVDDDSYVEIQKDYPLNWPTQATEQQVEEFWMSPRHLKAAMDTTLHSSTADVEALRREKKMVEAEKKREEKQQHAIAAQKLFKFGPAARIAKAQKSHVLTPDDLAKEARYLNLMDKVLDSGGAIVDKGGHEIRARALISLTKSQGKGKGKGIEEDSEMMQSAQSSHYGFSQDDPLIANMEETAIANADGTLFKEYLKLAGIDAAESDNSGYMPSTHEDANSSDEWSVEEEQPLSDITGEKVSITQEQAVEIMKRQIDLVETSEGEAEKGPPKQRSRFQDDNAMSISD